MSELLIEHPIPIIDDLLKLRIGDEGRLLYLRRAITNGKTIHESDRKFLKKMEEKIRKFKSEKISLKSKKELSLTQKIPDIEARINSTSVGIKDTVQINNDFESEIAKIKNSILEVKNSTSKIRDNLELLIINREILTKSTIEKPHSFSNLTQTYTSDMFDLIKDNPLYKNLSIFGMKKHDVMTFASAGLFALWYAGYQNVIDLGPFQGLTLGLSAGAAMTAGIFYNNYKKSQKFLFKNKKSIQK